MSKAHSNEASCSAEPAHVPLSTERSQHFIALIAAFSAAYLVLISSQNTAIENSHLWFLGAISVSLAYTFGFIGLCAGLALTFAADAVTGFENGVVGSIANLLFTTSISLTVLLPYFAHEQEKMSSRILSNSAETSIFIGLALLGSSVSVGL